MRLSLRISTFTMIGISGASSADGYVRGQREMRRLSNEDEPGRVIEAWRRAFSDSIARPYSGSSNSGSASEKEE